MPASIHRLLILLRIAYIVGAVLFGLDVLLALGVQAVDLVLTGDVAEESPLDPLMNTMILVAFAFVATGAVLTAVTTSAIAGQGVDVDADRTH